MPKGEIKVIHVPKYVTAVLWVLVSAGMAGLIYALSGRAYVQERASVADAVEMLRRGGPEQPAALLATVAPLIADILFFVPWGVLAFLVFDREGGSRARSYILTMFVGAAFALGLIAWQRTLPTRVTGWVDGMWNAVGCFAGAVIGHARKRMRVRFE
jgi:VanZ family protein